MLHRLGGRVTRGHLSGERGGLAAALETAGPAVDQGITLPDMSVIVMMVLLNVD